MTGKVILVRDFDPALAHSVPGTRFEVPQQVIKGQSSTVNKIGDVGEGG